MMIKRLGLVGGVVGSVLMGKECSAAEFNSLFSRNATCVLEPVLGSKVKGIVSFSQPSVNSPVKVASSLRDLVPNNLYTLYIH